MNKERIEKTSPQKTTSEEAFLILMKELNKGIEEADRGELHSAEETIAILPKKGIKI